MNGRKQESKFKEDEARRASPARGVVREALSREGSQTKLCDAASADTLRRREERERERESMFLIVSSLGFATWSVPPHLLLNNKPWHLGKLCDVQSSLYKCYRLGVAKR